MANWNKSKSQNTKVTESQIKIIKEYNHLDIQLYKYALKLFEKRMLLWSTNNDEVTTYLKSSLFSPLSQEKEPTDFSLKSSNFKTSTNAKNTFNNQTIVSLTKLSSNSSSNINTLKSLLKF